ncbi:hypothetical protein HUG17_7148 [Dermatophagoides farinae]|uniref:Uncharacterized protein n=1 Tax=Dermatophagoides farinae TaxID=6954 RepID=A0A9D4NS55_DERFA|nr:hypothetical protein HUG17_7148 [Dermatophagoides farinae]
MAIILGTLSEQDANMVMSCENPENMLELLRNNGLDEIDLCQRVLAILPPEHQDIVSQVRVIVVLITLL